MNELKIFDYEGAEIRTVIKDGEPWFVGKDVAEILGYADSNKAIAMHIDDEDKLNDKTASSLGQRGGWFINESGLYSLILSSKLPKAKEFKRWVTREVLPSIRKTGQYISKPKNAMEILELEFQAIKEISEKVDNLNDDLQSFKADIPLFAVECEELTKAVNKKVVSILGGKHTSAYKDNHFRGKVYTDIYREIKRQFGVSSYKAIKRSDMDFVKQILQNYKLPFALEQELGGFQSQIELK